ncbi:MAG: hypothetical protein Q8L43_04610, partial [Deltaproteobacteria bacterium]|nr:hypothetical protein [Deltaproteobacteria bacterium]
GSPVSLPQVQVVTSYLRRMFPWVVVDLGLPLDETAFAFLDMADRVDAARGVLKEEDQGLDDILESIDRVMEEVADEAASLAEAEVKLRRAQARADRLAQSGRLAEARSIYFYLLDNILSLEEKFKKEQLFSPDLKKELFEEYCQFIHEDRHLEKELVQQEIEQLESRTPISLGELDLSEVKRELALPG